jgi:hypothetical protein
MAVWNTAAISSHAAASSTPSADGLLHGEGADIKAENFPDSSPGIVVCVVELEFAHQVPQLLLGRLVNSNSCVVDTRQLLKPSSRPRKVWGDGIGWGQVRLNIEDGRAVKQVDA